MEMPCLCTNMDTNMVTGNQQKHLDFTSAIKMFSFSYELINMSINTIFIP